MSNPLLFILTGKMKTNSRNASTSRLLPPTSSFELHLVSCTITSTALSGIETDRFLQSDINT